MKKTICICICICLMSGCGKSLRHGRPANAVVEDKGSEGVPTHSLTSDASNASALAPSNTPAPTPEPSKSAPSSDTADTGSSVGKYVGYAVAVIALIVGCYDVFRYFKPIKVIAPKPEPAGDITLTLSQIQDEGYKYCHIRDRSIISYTWYLAKRKVKRYFWADVENKEIDSKIFVYQLHNDYYGSDNVYVYQSNPAPNY